MDKQIEQAAALALLDRGAAFHIPAPFLFRLFGRKKVRITVRRLRLGTLLYLTQIPGIDEATEFEVNRPDQEKLKQTVEATGAKLIAIDKKTIEDNFKPVCRIIASCLLNSELKIRLFSKPFGRYLRQTLNGDQVQELIMWLFVYGRAESFMNTIILIKTMRMTRPMNLSPEVQRSQGAKAPIAFGE